jgi:hypothetical protein
LDLSMRVDGHYSSLKWESIPNPVF